MAATTRQDKMRPADFKLLYASPAWWGSTSAADKQRLQVSVRRAIGLGQYTADDATPSQLAADIIDAFWSRFLSFLNVFFIFQINVFLFLKNVGKVQSGKQINKKHFQNNSNKTDL